MTSRRVVIALGGNAMTGPDGSATPGAQRDAIREASAHIADVVASGVDVVLTHGNGPQVGNLLVKNELAAHVVPPVPLDWNVAQTQATIAFTLADELDAALAARGLSQRTAGLVTRTLVDAAGGGGIPVSDDGRDGSGLRGVEAVIDKDLTAAILAREVDADKLVIATDVENVMVGFGTP